MINICRLSGNKVRPQGVFWPFKALVLTNVVTEDKLKADAMLAGCLNFPTAR